jgi:methylmalonyl-CoA mutase cobalamin-binding subunit
MRPERALPAIGVVQGNYPNESRQHLVQLGFMAYYTPDQIIEICTQALEAAGEAAKKNREAALAEEFKRREFDDLVGS